MAHNVNIQNVLVHIGHFTFKLQPVFNSCLSADVNVQQNIRSRVYREMKTKKERYYSSSLTALKNEFIAGQHPHVKDVIKLMKYWKNKHIKVTNSPECH